MSINAKLIFVTPNGCLVYHLDFIPFPVFTLLSILLLRSQPTFTFRFLVPSHRWFFRQCLVLQFRLRIGLLIQLVLSLQWGLDSSSAHQLAMLITMSLTAPVLASQFL